jgi:GT2 family glycosyltransferase
VVDRSSPGEGSAGALSGSEAAPSGVDQDLLRHARCLSALEREIAGRAEETERLRRTLERLEREDAARACELSRLRADVERIARAGAPRSLSPCPRPSLRTFVKALIGMRLQLEPFHAPRPLHVPRRYTRTRPPALPPSISIVTPSYNQGRFLVHTLDSVIEQGYPRLEYVVQDGGSEDGSMRVVERVRPHLHAVDSRPDRGQAHAINLGFARTSGEIMAYLNSDDLLMPGALSYVARYFAANPGVDAVYGHRVLIDEEGFEIGRWILPPHRDADLHFADYVPQETLFWRRGLWERSGGCIDESFQFAVDWDLLLRFLDAGARIVRVPRFLGAFRVHRDQKTSQQMAGLGTLEMDRLRRRVHGRALAIEEVRNGLLRFMILHAICRRLYQVGLVWY